MQPHKHNFKNIVEAKAGFHTEGGGRAGISPPSKRSPPQHFDNYAVTKQDLLAAKRSNTVILTLQLNLAVLFLENVKNFIKRYRTEFLGWGVGLICNSEKVPPPGKKSCMKACKVFPFHSVSAPQTGFMLQGRFKFLTLFAIKLVSWLVLHSTLFWRTNSFFNEFAHPSRHFLG